MTRDAPNREAIDFLIAEYQWASGLLPFYRQVELTVVGASALLLSAVASVVAVLEGGPKAEATVLSASAWGLTVLLLLEIMALTRIRRAALYIRDHIAVRAWELAGDGILLEWENLHAKDLFFRGEEEEVPRRRWFPVAILVSSAPVVLAVGLMAVSLALAGALVHPDAPMSAVLFVGYVAALVAVGLGIYGIRLSIRHEVRVKEKDHRGGGT